MATQSSVLAWRIPYTEEPDRLQYMGSQSRTWLSTHTYLRQSHSLYLSRLVICIWCRHIASHRKFFYLYYMVSLWVCLGLFSSVQSLSQVRLFTTPWTTAWQASLSITNSWSSPRLMSIELVMPSSYLIVCRPLLLLPSIFPNIRVFSNESALHIRWPKYWSFSFHISPSNEHPGLISFRMDLLDLFAVQETLKSLLQHHSSKASILWCSGFFPVQHSHPYMTTGKTIALIRWTFVDKVTSLLFKYAM